MVFTVLAGGAHASEDAGVITCTLHSCGGQHTPTFEMWMDSQVSKGGVSFEKGVKEQFKKYINETFSGCLRMHPFRVLIL